MPDITMCSNLDCPSRHKCVRHKDSGTKPCEYRQSYAMFTPDGDKCDMFWEKK